MNAIHTLVLAAALALSSTGHAAVLRTATTSAANTVTDYSAPGAVSFDLDLHDFGATRLDFTVEAEDLLGPISLNAIVRNLSGTALNDVTFRLDGIRFSQPGTVTPTFGTLGQVNHADSMAAIHFSAPEWAEFHLGDPLGEAGAANWLLSTTGLRAGDTFSIAAEVPEPSSPALMLAGLCMSALLLRRRQRG